MPTSLLQAFGKNVERDGDFACKDQQNLVQNQCTGLMGFVNKCIHDSLLKEAVPKMWLFSHNFKNCVFLKHYIKQENTSTNLCILSKKG